MTELFEVKTGQHAGAWAYAVHEFLSGKCVSSEGGYQCRASARAAAADKIRDLVAKE